MPGSTRSSGFMLALEHRERTGEGGLVEAAMVDAAANVAAEQPIEFSAYGALLGTQREPRTLRRTAEPLPGGRSGRARPRRLVGGDRRGDRRAVAGAPPGHGRAGLGGRAAYLATAAGRVAGHDRIDAHLQEWCRGQRPTIMVEQLWEAGVPGGEGARSPTASPIWHSCSPVGFFEEVEHPVIGASRYSTLPDAVLAWSRTAARAACAAARGAQRRTA